jgi:prepilin-type N-terminal cleavage/methylation domain-containing protein
MIFGRLLQTSRFPKTAQQGFTLLEVLVTGVLVSIVVALAFYSLGFFLKGWQQDRLETRGPLERFRIRILVQNALESVWEYNVTDPSSERRGAYYPFFQGSSNSVTFITSSSVFRKFGTAVARLRLEAPRQGGVAGNAADLIYEETALDEFFVKYHGDTLSFADRAVVERNVTALNIRYYGPREVRFSPERFTVETTYGWMDQFDGREQGGLPSLIEIRWDRADGERRIRTFHVQATGGLKGRYLHRDG